ncbi:anti-sigma factor [Thermopolyspora sp. NPDC052614]|uniref:anti-sigma factor n=1 Tax=Thermopolyspora sp. NPDC052614 TaxID=3155682 RepID=UPI00341DE415
MNDDLHTLSGAYALNALPEQQQRLFEEHMARCEACLIEVRGLRETAARLGLAAAEEPPPGLRARVLARIAEVRQEPPIVPPGALGGLGNAYDRDPYGTLPTGGLPGHPQDPGGIHPQDPLSPYSPHSPHSSNSPYSPYSQDPGQAYRQDSGLPQEPGAGLRPDPGAPYRPGASYPPEGIRVYPPDPGPASPQSTDGSYRQDGLDVSQTIPRLPDQAFLPPSAQNRPAEASPPQEQTRPYPRDARPAYPPGLGRPTEWRALAEEGARQATPNEQAPASSDVPLDGPLDGPFASGDRPAVPAETPMPSNAAPSGTARPVVGLPSDPAPTGRGRSAPYAGGGSVLDFDQARRSPRAGWGTRIAAVAATISTAAAVALGYLVYDTNQQLNQVRIQSQTVAAILAAPDAKTVVRPVTSGGSATIVRSRSANRIVFTASGLANLPASKAYELWLMGPDGPRPAGLLQRGPDGTVVPIVALPLADEEQVGLTVEPAAGSAKPTTQPILLTKLPSA